jgi:Uma2 family endonuclease
MTPAKILLTADEFDNYPFEEDKRYELDEGELIEMTRPAYRHNRVLKNLQTPLDNYLRGSGVGELLLSENLFALSALTRRAPDAAIILGDRSAELWDAKVIHIIPEIVVEVLSPSETTPKIHRKLKQYFAVGVKEVWLVDPEAREAEIWTGPTLPEHTLTEGDMLVSALLPGFALPLKDLFA